MTWSVDAPDNIVSGTGCTRVIRFGSTGAREVRVASVDHEGREGSNLEVFNVTAAARESVSAHRRIWPVHAR
jgi:hypothetical protein